MRASVLLGVTPLALFGGVYLVSPGRAPALVTVPVKTEGVRVVAMDTRTFTARWRAVYDMPPMSVMESVYENVETAHKENPPASQRVVDPHHKRDICLSHGLRKVRYGKRWRCAKWVRTKRRGYFEGNSPTAKSVTQGPATSGSDFLMGALSSLPRPHQTAAQ